MSLDLHPVRTFLRSNEGKRVLLTYSIGWQTLTFDGYATVRGENVIFRKFGGRKEWNGCSIYDLRHARLYAKEQV